MMQVHHRVGNKIFLKKKLFIFTCEIANFLNTSLENKNLVIHILHNQIARLDKVYYNVFNMLV